MRRTVLWIAVVGALVVVGLFEFRSYLSDKTYRSQVSHLEGVIATLDAKVRAQKEVQEEREFWVSKIQEALPPPTPEILYTNLTFDQVKQAVVDGNVTCIGAYPLAGIEYSGDILQFALESGESFHVILLEKGKDVFPSFIQFGALYTVCRDTNGTKRVVWVDSGGFSGMKPIPRSATP